MADRAQALQVFLDRAGWGAAKRARLAGDASFRHYERLSGESGTAVLMDAPPPKEDIRPFLRIARHLAACGLSAPRILAEDAERGFLLIEDFGDAVFGRLLGEGADIEPLFAAAVDALVALQRPAPPQGVPSYLEPEMAETACLLTDWYLPAATGEATSADLRADFIALWRQTLTIARSAGLVLVHRDFFADNLMWLRDRQGIARVGLLDFQDAALGFAPYDLASLLQDARRDIPEDLEERMIRRYLAATGADEQEFRRAYAICGAQRAARIVGLWVRLWKRDGKRRYLAFMGRTWDVLERDLAHPALVEVKGWFDRHLPPRRRRLDFKEVAA
ncbi:MAG: aminoglycoside phosphotransferase [Alphaproteobacteria bacterium]|nr:aminoglycoside phosphotransferase [Alphaproteobacteria bacterium]